MAEVDSLASTREPWDLVLTDLEMPEVSGWDVIEAIRHRAPTMPILVITAYDDPVAMRRAREWRVPMIPKPFRLETLKAEMVQALHPRRKTPDGLHAASCFEKQERAQVTRATLPRSILCLATLKNLAKALGGGPVTALLE